MQNEKDPIILNEFAIIAIIAEKVGFQIQNIKKSESKLWES